MGRTIDHQVIMRTSQPWLRVRFRAGDLTHHLRIWLGWIVPAFQAYFFTRGTSLERQDS